MTATRLPLSLCTLCLLPLALASGPAAAQADNEPSQAPPAIIAQAPLQLQHRILLQDGAMPQPFSFTGSAPGQVVKGAPYCAEPCTRRCSGCPIPTGPPATAS